MATEAWVTFETRMREIEDLSATLGLLGWDEQTYCSPKGRAPRAQHSATLAALTHERIVDPAYGDAIETLANDGAGLSEAQRAMVRLAKHDRDRSVKLPAPLVRELREQASRANAAWEEARHANDFAIWEPELVKMLALKVRQAGGIGTAQVGERAGRDPVDAAAAAQRVVLGPLARLVRGGDRADRRRRRHRPGLYETRPTACSVRCIANRHGAGVHGNGSLGDVRDADAGDRGSLRDAGTPRLG